MYMWYKYVKYCMYLDTLCVRMCVSFNICKSKYQAYTSISLSPALDQLHCPPPWTHCNWALPTSWPRHCVALTSSVQMGWEKKNASSAKHNRWNKRIPSTKAPNQRPCPEWSKKEDLGAVFGDFVRTSREDALCETAGPHLEQAQMRRCLAA